MKKLIDAGLIVAAAAGLYVAAAFAQQINWDAVQIKATKVSGNVWMLEGQGGNIAVLVGEDGVLLVDDQFAPLTEKIVAAVKKISDKPIRYLVNTHWHGDHTGGNENLGNMGVQIVAHDNVRKRLETDQATLLGKNPAQPKVALPVITFDNTVTYHVNGETMHVYKVPPAHTDGDVFVRFQGAKVVHTGDVFAAYRYPYVDTINGGSVAGIVKAMDALIPTLDDDTKVIPGHGSLSTKKDVIAYRNMIATVDKRVAALVKQGKSLPEVQAAKPTKDFDEIWGKPRSGDEFVKFLYYGHAPYKG
jgi:glyoxylase-like metal-dependent hydrolase (beta-lactamase superfamily II)